MRVCIELNQLLSIILIIVFNFDSRKIALTEAKKIKVTTTAASQPTRKVCHRHGSLDQIFTRTFSVISMQRYCEMLDSFSKILSETTSSWSRISTPDGSCYDEANWRFERQDFNFLLKALFRHHLDVNKDERMDALERRRFLMPSLRYHLLPGLLRREYQYLMDTYFSASIGLSEAEFVSVALRMMEQEWPMLTRRMLADLDGDNCVTKIEFARAVCRKQISDIDFFFRLADLDNNRAVTSPEFEIFKSITPVEAGEEQAAERFFNFFNSISNMITNYAVDYFQQTSYAHDDMITFNEVNLYICEYVI